MTAPRYWPTLVGGPAHGAPAPPTDFRHSTYVVVPDPDREMYTPDDRPPMTGPTYEKVAYVPCRFGYSGSGTYLIAWVHGDPQVEGGRIWDAMLAATTIPAGDWR